MTRDELMRLACSAEPEDILAVCHGARGSEHRVHLFAEVGRGRGYLGYIRNRMARHLERFHGIQVRWKPRT